MKKKARSETFTFDVSGDFAMFLSPATKKSCEWHTYKFPTYSALIGILKNIYSFPGIIWHIEKVRVMNRIQFVSLPVRSAGYYENRSRYNHTYLYMPKYQVCAYYTLDWSGDQKYCNWHHAWSIRKRIQNGHNVITLGKNGCVGYVRPCVFGEGESYYDDIDEATNAFMFYDFVVERNLHTMEQEKYVSFCQYSMGQGIIDWENWKPISIERG